jgi:hypothetical protein
MARTQGRLGCSVQIDSRGQKAYWIAVRAARRRHAAQLAGTGVLRSAKQIAEESPRGVVCRPTPAHDGLPERM